ncbi:MAG: hypothetical protein LUC90_05605 [Lachnospiraceae bacterium]|nr:hypothetical protein [Lachnospiraceae bacterium]
MKKMNKPENDIAFILDNCIVGMREPRKKIIEQVKDTIIEKSDKYDQLADQGLLYTIPEHDNVNLIASKEDMKFLYSQKFVSKGQRNRDYYDKIRSSAPNGICPYCQQNMVDTLDHFLPKSKYVTFTVTPFNLVPVCAHCNKDKLASTFSSYAEQPFHPYYDDFDDCIWLKAKMIEHKEITFQFYADPPENIEPVKAERIKRSFSDGGFGLNNIYKVHAAEVYQVCFKGIKSLYDKGGKELAVESLSENVKNERSINKNSWKAAMYQAMIDCNWYWSEYICSL